jgi:molybdopterin-containing oxidoreductase family molybdopterin binding subunit
MHRLFDAMENGTKFVNVDPRFSRSSAKADEWIAPRPGTDAALVMGMLHVIVSEGLMKQDYVVAHTNGPFLVRRDTQMMLRASDLGHGDSNAYMVWDDAVGAAVPVESAASPALTGGRTLTGTDGEPVECWTGFDANWDVWKRFTPEYASSVCEVPADQIRHVAREYAGADPAWIWLGFGSQRYAHGHLGPRAWITLATLCGNIGKPYAGVNLNESPGLVLAFNAPASYLKPSGQSAPSLPATRLLDIIENDDPWPIKSMWMVASGFGTQTPFLDRFVRESLPKLDLLVVNEQLMSPIAQHADVVLPVVSYYEDDWDLIASGETWFVQLRRRVVPPVGESRSDHDIFQQLCERLGHGEHWQEPPDAVCRRLLAENGDARMRAVDWETLVRDGVARIVNEVPYTPFKDMKFQTASGRIELYQEQFVPEGEAALVHKEPMESRVSVKAREFPLCLISYKHPHSSHAQHLMLPYIREMMPEPRVEISPVDAADRDIADGDLVRVYNDRGTFTVKALLTPGLKPGTMAIAQGWWPRDFLNGHPSFLGHAPRDVAQEKVAAMGNEANYPIWDLLCNVVKAEATQ